MKEIQKIFQRKPNIQNCDSNWNNIRWFERVDVPSAKLIDLTLFSWLLFLQDTFNQLKFQFELENFELYSRKEIVNLFWYGAWDNYFDQNCELTKKSFQVFNTLVLFKNWFPEKNLVEPYAVTDLREKVFPYLNNQFSRATDLEDENFDFRVLKQYR